MAKKNGKKNGKKKNVIIKRNAKKSLVKTIARSRLSIGARTRKFALSMTNPFEYSACIPDGSNNTGCFSSRGMNVISTGAGSAGAFLLGLDPRNQTYLDSASAVATYSLPGASTWNATSSIGSIMGLYARVRPVSAGFRFTFSGADQTNSGVAVLGQISGAINPSALNGANASTTVGFMQNVEMFAAKQGGIIVWRPEDEEDHTFFGPGTASNTLAAAVGKPYLFLGLTNMATAGAGTVVIEWVVHYEGQFRDLQFQPGGFSNSPAPAEPGWFENGMKLISRVKPIVIGLGNMASWIASQGNFYNIPGPNNNGARIMGITNRGPIIEEV